MARPLAWLTASPMHCMGRRKSAHVPWTSKVSARTDCRPAPLPATLVRPRQVEHVLRDEVQDHVGRDRRHHVEPRLAELALDVIFLGEAETAMGLHAHV